MANEIYVGVGGKARRAKKMYIGVGGTARRVCRAYIGVNGIARPCYFYARTGTVVGTGNWIARIINNEQYGASVYASVPPGSRLRELGFVKSGSYTYVHYEWLDHPEYKDGIWIADTRYSHLEWDSEGTATSTKTGLSVYIDKNGLVFEQTSEGIARWIYTGGPGGIASGNGYYHYLDCGAVATVDESTQPKFMYPGVYKFRLEVAIPPATKDNDIDLETGKHTETNQVTDWTAEVIVSTRDRRDLYVYSTNYYQYSIKSDKPYATIKCVRAAST